jgi:hypothetical protein
MNRLYRKADLEYKLEAEPDSRAGKTFSVLG